MGRSAARTTLFHVFNNDLISAACFETDWTNPSQVVPGSCNLIDRFDVAGVRQREFASLKGI